MPSPYNVQHNSYLRKYMATGVEHIINSRRELEGKHKDGHTFPLSIFVTKIDNGGDVSFMGVISQVIEQNTQSILTITKMGNIRTVNAVFGGMFGYTSSEVVGKPVSTVMTKATVDGLLAQMQTAAAEARPRAGRIQRLTHERCWVTHGTCSLLTNCRALRFQLSDEGCRACGRRQAQKRHTHPDQHNHHA